MLLQKILLKKIKAPRVLMPRWPKLHNIKLLIARAYEEKRACNSQCIYCVVVKLLMSQQDILYLANRPHVNRRDSGREHCYTRNLPQN